MPPVPDLPPEILAFYEAGGEAERLSLGKTGGPLELARTIELISRYLPPAPLDILDVGGGPGRYGAWLVARGDRVLVVDPVPLHVEQARSQSVAAEVGDARHLRQADASFDVVLLMGPLYHLPDADERAQALAQARRVLRPGGLLIATAIARHAALLHLLIRLDGLHEPDVLKIVRDALRTGAFHGLRQACSPPRSSISPPSCARRSARRASSRSRSSTSRVPATWSRTSTPGGTTRRGGRRCWRRPGWSSPISSCSARRVT
jgi:SAM-dependent methyltransferase